MGCGPPSNPNVDLSAALSAPRGLGKANSNKPWSSPPTPAPKPKDSPVPENVPVLGSYTPCAIRFCPISVTASCNPSSPADCATLRSLLTTSVAVPEPRAFLSVPKRFTIARGANISNAPGPIPKRAASPISSSVAPAAIAR